MTTDTITLTLAPKILLIQTAFIGDVVLATPLIEQLHRFFPAASIDFLLRKGNESLLTDHPKLRKIIVWKKKEAKYAQLWKILVDVRREKYDVVINLQRFGATGLLTVLSGASQTIGFDKNPFSFFFSKKIRHKIGSLSQPLHEVERNLALLEPITGGGFDRPRLYPSPQDYDFVKNYQSGDYVCLAPTSVWFTKQLPIEKWLELIAQLPDLWHIYLLGAQTDSAVCEEIIKKSGHKSVHNLAGKLSFLASAALMSGSKMNYVNDSAPLHFASAMNAPVTAFFCSTLPSFGFYPLSEVSFVAETAMPLACRPCGLHGKSACPERHFRCAKEILMPHKE